MYFDLNVPIPSPTAGPSTAKPQQQSQGQSKKGKGKASAAQAPTVSYTPAQMAKIEPRVDLLVRLNYTVIAFNQIVHSKIDPKTHANTLDPLLAQLRKRERVLFLKRLTIVLDEDSEKGFGLTIANSALFTPYDIIALQPTTAPSFSQACLTHSSPSPLTAHIISLPLTLPRLPFHLKHTLVRTALKNGAVFEINYSGALLGEGERRNWWAAAREVARVTKGKGVLVSGGAENDVDVRAPRDAGNLITLLGIPQDLVHHAATTTPKSLIRRAQTRKTYRAVFSEPVLILPSTDAQSMPEPTAAASVPEVSQSETTPVIGDDGAAPVKPVEPAVPSPIHEDNSAVNASAKKRRREDETNVHTNGSTALTKTPEPEGSAKKKRKRKDKGNKETGSAGQ
ncbi:PHP domain-like protein, partial [Rickenella mellea]